MEFRTMELQNSHTGTGKRRRDNGDFEGDNFVSSDDHLELVSSSSSDLSKEEAIESSSNTEMEHSTPKKKRKNSSAEDEATSPSAGELDEFFSKAERYDHKRFAEKYNYDIVKDVPIEGGSYQWIRLSITPTANQ